MPAALARSLHRCRDWLRLPHFARFRYDRKGKPIPAANNPRQIFEGLFKGNRGTLEAQRARLRLRMKLVDAVNPKTPRPSTRIWGVSIARRWSST